MDQRVLQTDRHRYVIVSWLAYGSTNAIYRGRRIDANATGKAKEVVLKHLLPEHNADEKLVEMFKREAVISHSLSHRNIVRTLDLVEAEGDYYIVMEFVRGGDLRSLLRRARRRQARLSLASALFIVSEVLAALGYAHDKQEGGRPLGLIHRDVSPSNVLLGDRGEVKLTDFGIVKTPTQRSIVFKVKGKIGYMAPEQARGEPVDRRADLFAAGVVLYELLVGERLFIGSALSSPAEIFAQPVVPPSRRRSDVPAELDAIVVRALALDREQRFPTATQMRDALVGFAQRAGYALSEQALAEDLRRACGDDPSTWLDLDVPVHTTLDGGGTGIIQTDDAGDDFSDDRPSFDRSSSLPARELTSVVHLPSAHELGEPVTELADDPFAPTLAVRIPDEPSRDELSQEEPSRDEPSPDQPSPYQPSIEDFDDRQETRVASRRTAPQRLASGPRATFEPPVPRPSPPLPDAALVREPFRDEPTRLSSSKPVTTLPQPTAPDGNPKVLSGPTPLLVSSPISVPIALLDRALRERKSTRLVVTLLGLIMLVALGVWVGVLLSGDTNP